MEGTVQPGGLLLRIESQQQMLSGAGYRQSTLAEGSGWDLQRVLKGHLKEISGDSGRHESSLEHSATEEQANGRGHDGW